MTHHLKRLQPVVSRICLPKKDFLAVLASDLANRRAICYRNLSRSLPQINLHLSCASSARLGALKRITMSLKPQLMVLTKEEMKTVTRLLLRRKTPIRRRKVLVSTNIPTL